MDRANIRYRKLDSDEIGPKSRGSSEMRRSHPPYKLLRLLFYIVAFSLTSLCVLVMLNNTWPFKNHGHKVNMLDKISVRFGLQQRLDAVVIDAGSTGSRVLAFTFYKTLTDNVLKLDDDELWHEIKPGLSSYADNPKQGAESLLSLLSLAKDRIPSNKWASTPLVLRATAGLRLLPEEKANALLKEVQIVIDNSGFLTSESSVEIMDGKDEGIFSWFTANYLMDRIGGSSQHTLVALDLGGGSTQITYIPSDNAYTEKSADYLSPISLMGQNLNIFTHSYLGLGLMASRAAILSLQSDQKGFVNSSCINPIVNIDWSYGDQLFHVRGPPNPKYRDVKGVHGRIDERRPVADFADCVRMCTNYVEEKVKNVPAEITWREIIAFSYYFDKATERGLIDPYDGGIITVQKFVQEAKEACEIPNVDQPFSCLDMALIGSLLHKGYGIDAKNHIKLYKKIDGHELSWALGLAFQIISNGA